jgi:hypothetical protein
MSKRRLLKLFISRSSRVSLKNISHLEHIFHGSQVTKARRLLSWSINCLEIIFHGIEEDKSGERNFKADASNRLDDGAHII